MLHRTQTRMTRLWRPRVPRALGLLVALAVLITIVAPARAGLTPEQKCQAGKNKTVGKYAACLESVGAKRVAGGDPVKYADAVAKCGTTFANTWRKLETKAGSGVCPSEGDESFIQSFLDACIFSTEAALGGGTLPINVTTCNTALSSTDAALSTCNTVLSSTATALSTCNTALSSASTALTACHDAQLTLLRFQSTVTFVYFDLPSGIAVDDTVAFSLTVSMSEATPTGPIGSRCFGPVVDCREGAWTFSPPVPYLLTYSSGYVQVGQIDRIEITDGGFQDFGGGFMSPAEDTIVFYDEFNDIWEAKSFNGSWFSGPIPGDLATATNDIDQAGLFDLTFYWGSWNTWGTYHYDYIRPQLKTIVTKSP